ncbi:MAG: ATP-binding protein, partial [Nitriliruptorales bacterium]|nr:ATP-binding protein [Nitriliruptorales bacterium]
PAAVELFGVGEEELLTRRLGDEAWDMRGPDGDNVPHEDRQVHRVLTTGKGVRGMELSALRGDGRRVHWETSASPLLGPDGAVIGVVAVLRDISKQRMIAERLEDALRRERAVSEELRELNELKNTFLQAVSHELRTPLTSVMGFADLLEQHERLSSDQFDQIIRRLRANAVRLDRLLSDLLDLDRLSRGTLEPRRTAVDLHDLIGRTVEQLGLLGRVQVAGNQVVAKIDGPRTERIVENLVMNAHKHTPPNSEIAAGTEVVDGGVVIYVDDRGPGIPDEQKKAIFEAFRQGDSPAARTGGAGIGLSLVAAFAGLHGGEAWVEDRADGGSSFRVHLPAEVLDVDGL